MILEFQITLDVVEAYTDKDIVSLNITGIDEGTNDPTVGLCIDGRTVYVPYSELNEAIDKVKKVFGR